MIIAFSWSCKKSGPAEAIITVKNSGGQNVAGARVVLRQDSVTNTVTGIRADIYQEQTTGSTGDAIFSFDNEAVLNIQVTKDSISNDDEYVRLEQNKTVRKTVIIG